MLRSLIYLLIAFIFSTSNIAMGQTETLSKVRGSRLALLKLMNDPYAKSAYKSLQFKLLNNSVDYELREFFETNPVLANTFTQLQDAQAKLTEDFFIESATGKIKIRPNSPGRYKKLHAMVIRAAVDLGVTEEAIKNLKIYITFGDVNAYTISGSEKELIVVIQKGLFDSLTDSEIAAVLGHEIGHVLSKHVSISILSRVLMNIGAIYFGQGNAGLQQLKLNSSQFIDYMYESPCKYHDHDHKDLTSKNIGVKASATAEGEFNKIIGNMLNVNPSLLLGTMHDFLAIIFNNSKKIGLPGQTSAYIFNLINIMQQQAQNKLGEVKLNLEEFPKHAEIIFNALSRVKEDSADQYSGSIMPNEIIASAFAKLMGADFDPKHRKIIFQHIREDIREFYKKYNYEERIKGLGTTHPAIGLRIDSILSIDKYPSVPLANPFLRLVMLRDELHLKATEAKARISEGEVALTQDIPERLSVEQKAQVKKQIEDFTLQAMIDEEGFQTATTDVESTLLRLMLEQRLIKSDQDYLGSNPRIDNFIQLTAFKKEIKYFQVQELQRLLADETDADKKSSMAQTIASIEQLNAQTEPLIEPLIQALLRLKGSSNKPTNVKLDKYIKLLEELSVVKSMEDGERLRAKVSNFAKSTSLPKSLRTEGCESLLAKPLQ